MGVGGQASLPSSSPCAGSHAPAASLLAKDARSGARNLSTRLCADPAIRLGERPGWRRFQQLEAAEQYAVLASAPMREEGDTGVPAPAGPDLRRQRSDFSLVTSSTLAMGQPAPEGKPCCLFVGCFPVLSRWCSRRRLLISSNRLFWP